MTFVQPSILLALAALAIPLAIHLLGQRRARRLILPTARFADAAHQETRGRMWLKRLSLLALRLAAVALLVLTLAGPQVVRGTPDPAGSPRTPAPAAEPRAPATAPTTHAVRLLVVDAAEEPGVRLRSADLVAAAFAGEATGRKVVARCTAAQADRAALDAADAVFWVGSQAPPAPGLVETFLARGSVVWVPADRRPPDVGLAQALALQVTAAEENPEGWTMDPAAYTSDLLGAFEGGTSGDVGAPVLRRRFVLGAAGAGEVRFRDGAPAILDRRCGQGRVLALAAGPGPDWGDLAGRPDFVVLMHSLAEALTPGNADRDSAAAPTPKDSAVAADAAGFAQSGAPSSIDLSSWFILALAASLAAESLLGAVHRSPRQVPA